MAVFHAAFRTTGAGSTTLPAASIYGVAGVRAVVKEIGISNSTATACCVGLRRVTTTGTQGTGQTEVTGSDTAQSNLAQVFDTHTVAPTFTAGNIRAFDLGAAIGSGVIWTFDRLTIGNATTEGIVIVPITGTGQILTVNFTWEE